VRRRRRDAKLREGREEGRDSNWEPRAWRHWGKRDWRRCRGEGRTIPCKTHGTLDCMWGTQRQQLSCSSKSFHRREYSPVLNFPLTFQIIFLIASVCLKLALHCLLIKGGKIIWNCPLSFLPSLSLTMTSPRDNSVSEPHPSSRK
jgi:hypothetical protein